DVGWEAVARGVLCVEYFPYHSENFASRKLADPLPSQAYSFWLVRRAMDLDAVILIGRGARLWFEQVPRLQHYHRKWRLNSTGNTIVSMNNCPDGYKQAVEVLKQVNKW